VDISTNLKTKWMEMFVSKRRTCPGKKRTYNGPRLVCQINYWETKHLSSYPVSNRFRPNTRMFHFPLLCLNLM